MGKLITRTASAAAYNDGNLESAAAMAAVPIDDLENVSVTVVQRVDNGTCTLAVETADDAAGAVFAAFGSTLDEDDFAAAANAGAAKIGLDSTLGRPLRAAFVRLNCTAYTGSGEYDLIVTGTRRPEWDAARGVR